MKTGLLCLLACMLLLPSLAYSEVSPTQFATEDGIFYDTLDQEGYQRELGEVRTALSEIDTLQGVYTSRISKFRQDLIDRDERRNEARVKVEKAGEKAEKSREKWLQAQEDMVLKRESGTGDVRDRGLQAASNVRWAQRWKNAFFVLVVGGFVLASIVVWKVNWRKLEWKHCALMSVGILFSLGALLIGSKLDSPASPPPLSPESLRLAEFADDPKRDPTPEVEQLREKAASNVRSVNRRKAEYSKANSRYSNTRRSLADATRAKERLAGRVGDNRDRRKALAMVKAGL